MGDFYTPDKVPIIFENDSVFFFHFRCFIPNIYGALFTAALVPLVCLVVVFVVFIHVYQVTPQWKAYDDVFRGRTNAAGMKYEICDEANKADFSKF